MSYRYIEQGYCIQTTFVDYIFHFFPSPTISDSYIYEIETLKCLIGNWGLESGFDNVNTQDTSRASNLKLREYTDIAQKTWLYFSLGANQEVYEEEYNNYHHKYRVAARKNWDKKDRNGASFQIRILEHRNF